jgi:hypothetical protein
VKPLTLGSDRVSVSPTFQSASVKKAIIDLDGQPARIGLLYQGKLRCQNMLRSCADNCSGSAEAKTGFQDGALDGARQAPINQLTKHVYVP